MSPRAFGRGAPLQAPGSRIPASQGGLAAPGAPPGGAFRPYPVAQGNQRTSGSGLVGPAGAARASQTINGVVASGKTVQFPAAGKSFYLLATSAPIQIRPSNGAWDTYYQGTGLSVDDSNLFPMVEVQNPGTNPVAFSLWVGFGDYIDRRLIVSAGTSMPVWYQTYSNPPLGGPVSITDLSGGPFQDLNGGAWLAIQRLAFYVDNASNSNVLAQNAAGSHVAGIVFPGTTRTFPVSGNFFIPGGSLNIEVAELYSAIPNTT